MRVVRLESIDFEANGIDFNCLDLKWGLSDLISCDVILSGEEVNGKELLCYPLSFATRIIADYNTYLLIRDNNVPTVS